MMKRKTKLRKALRLGLILAITLITVVSIVGFAFGPAFIAKRFNSVGNRSFPPLGSSLQALHQSLTIADLHADSLLWGRDLSKLETYGHVDIPRSIEGNVALQTFTVVTKVPDPLRLEGNDDRTDNITKFAILQRWPLSTWFGLMERALYQAKQLHNVENKALDRFKIVKTKQDLSNYLDRRQQDRKIVAGLLGLEGTQALEGKIENVNRLYAAGFRLIGLSHFFDNEVAGSAHGARRSGLTPFGREVLKRMEDLNLIVDLAHASSQTIDDVLQISHRPVLVSHTGVQGTCNNARNLSDRQLQQIAKTGGIIGIGFWKTAVCGEDANAIVRAIRYTVDRVGIDHVALGSDFDGAVRLPFDVANIGQITRALKQEGFTDIEIGKIMGLNTIDLLQQLLPT